MIIAERLTELEQTFNRLNETKQKIINAYFLNAHKDIEDELLRLQGEYRGLQALQDEEKPVEDTVVPEAEIVKKNNKEE